MFDTLEHINTKPELYSSYTAKELWTDEHTAKQMLSYHLNTEVDAASRNKDFIEQSVAWINDTLRITRDTQICDFGCGPGLYTQKFATLGAEVTGIDFSENSLAYAREQADQAGLTIDYIHQDYLEYRSDKKFDIITMIMCDFCALSDSQRASLLQNFMRHLNDDGSIVLDLYTKQFYTKSEPKAIYEKNLLGGFWSAHDYYGFLNTFKYDDDSVILDKYTIITPSSKKEVYNWLKCFDLKSIKEEVEKEGFFIERYLSDLKGTPYSDQHTEMALLLKKSS